MQRKESTFDAKCWKCHASIAVGQEFVYDESAARGQRTYCNACGTVAMKAAETAVKDPAAELAALKRKLAEMDKPMPAPIPVPKPAASADPLAAAIAAAVEPLIAGKMDESRVMDLIREYMKPPVRTITVKTPTNPEGVDMGRQHKQFEELLLICNARTRNGHRLNVWITGTAGTGKTTAAENVAKALALRFWATGSLTDTLKLFGWISPGTGQYVRTGFRDVWEFGGVGILDDFDGSDPTAAIETNQMLANGYCCFPDATVKRHPDCVIILTANTWGTGAMNEYIGRVKQDGAFLDRFVFLDWAIDEDLERDTAANDRWVARVQQVRANVARKGLKILVTPRASYYGAALLAEGMDWNRVEQMVLRKGMTDEHWRSVCGNA